MAPGVESEVRLEAGEVSLGRLVVMVVFIEAEPLVVLGTVDIGLELLFEAV